jgi:toxin YoeB
VSWKVVYAKQAVKDSKKLASSDLKRNAQKLLSIIEQDPFKTPPRYEKLIGDLDGAYSRRLNIQHRIVYQVCEGLRTVKFCAFGRTTIRGMQRANLRYNTPWL